MSLIDGWRHRLRTWLHRSRFESELSEEMQIHREMEERSQMENGAEREEAEYAARRAMGSEAWHRDEVRRAAGLERLDTVRQDLRFALRGLRREPFFAAFIIITLSLGIGANSAIFAVVDRLLLRGPDHVEAPSQLVRFYLSEQPRGRPGFITSYLGYAGYTAITEGNGSLSGTAAYSTSSWASGAGTEARQLQVSAVTASFFPLLGVSPRRGRFFNSREDSTAGAEQVVVLSHRLWQDAYGSDPDILGKAIDINSQSFTIVGIGPAGFTGAELEPVDAWIPMSLLGAQVTENWTTAWNAQWLKIIGRIRPGITVDRVASEATAAVLRSFTDADTTATYRMLVAPLSANDQGGRAIEARVSGWLIGVTLLVLVIAWANVINLLLARSVRRQREVAIRLALGAGRSRLIRLFLIEGLTLALIAGLFSLAVAWGLGVAIRGVLLPNIEWTALPVDSRVIIITALAVVATGLMVGLVPALRAGTGDLNDSLKSGVREGGGRTARGRQILTAVQAAISVVLLVGALLFADSLSNIRNLDIGIEPSRTIAVTVNWPSRRALSAEEREIDRGREQAFYDLALERVAGLPGVEHASLSVGLPFQSSFMVDLRIPGWDSVPRVAGGRPNISAVTGGYFATVGTPILRGRAFSSSDRNGSEAVAIVSDLMARTVWPGRDPIGQCLFIGDEDAACARIVGVAGDTRRDNLKERPTMHYYIPKGQEKGFGGTTLLIRPRGSPTDVTDAIRRAMIAINPASGYIKLQTLQEIIDPQIQPWRLGATVFGLAGGLALIVAGVGLFSVLSYLISQRKHEIGVRIALGAPARSITTLVLRSSLGMVLAGVAAGTAIALIAGRFIQGVLFDTSATDPGILLTGCGTLLLVAFVASLIPAWRANRVDPLQALRTD